MSTRGKGFVYLAIGLYYFSVQSLTVRKKEKIMLQPRWIEKHTALIKPNTRDMFFSYTYNSKCVHSNKYQCGLGSFKNLEASK